MLLFGQTNSFYKLVRAADSDDSDKELLPSPEGDIDIPKPQNQWVPFAFCILCTIANLLISILLLRDNGRGRRPFSPADLSRWDLSTLRRPSQYIRFNEVSRPAVPVPKTFDNFPFLIGPLDSTTPKAALNDDPRRYMSHIGTLSPEVRNVVVTNTVSTLAQFRAIDYGMEVCEMHLRLPKAPSGVKHSSTVTVYRLEATVPLNAKHISFQSKPKRVTKIADVEASVSEEVHWHRKFSCVTEEILTFEIACSEVIGSRCALEWWQEANSTAPGKYLKSFIFCL
ncbi:hypothetical protein C8J56DRAFT_868963 [Mycena floridula]|nr:hypothetical protein C8J56DRAFT_868963 [Mycena floridula]